MNETRPIYIDCASGAAPRANIAIRRVGDLVETQGHSQTLMTAADARKAGETYIALADAIECEKPPKIAAGEISKLAMDWIRNMQDLKKPPEIAPEQPSRLLQNLDDMLKATRVLSGAVSDLTACIDRIIDDLSHCEDDGK